MERALIIIPAYNEAKNISNVIEELQHDFVEADILVVNDNSKDQTHNVVEEKGVKCLDLPFNMGYASALQCGFKYACLHGYDYVIQFDGDGQHMAAEARKLFFVIKETSADIVLGSRFLEKNDYRHSMFRKIGTALFRFIIKATCKKQISDPTSGLQVLSKRCFRYYSAMDNFPEYPDANLIIEMLKKGFDVIELPVKMRNRSDGVSMHDGIIKPLKYVLVMLYSIAILLFKQNKALGNWGIFE